MWSKFLLLLAALAVATADQSPRKLYRYQGDELTASPFEDPIDGINWRLPNNTRPIHYEIFLTTSIHMAEFAFSGHVEIIIEAVEDTNVITLHFRELTISDVVMVDLRTSSLMNVSFTLEQDREFLHIHPENFLAAGDRYLVIVDYAGTLRNDDAGFYRSWYERNGERVWLATTQFQATDARHAFPWSVFKLLDRPSNKPNLSVATTNLVSDQRSPSQFNTTKLTLPYPTCPSLPDNL